ncbi:hypothetical protein ACFWOY_34595 [Streptomyces sp. NPDC058423]|uniref:Mu transposase domain-containing protein n=1 Tax=unclassified Streptomyces TaxID=2593676 RepID=UPI00365464DB
MLALPPIAPPGWWKAFLRLPRDHYVRLETCDYSVHPLAVGRGVAADLGQEPGPGDLRRGQGRWHARSWGRHQTITDPDHAAAPRPPERRPSAPSRRQWT